MSWKPLFSRSLGAAADRLHFAAHSHHLWPDTSFEAHDRAWVDAAEYADLKWERVFGEIWPSVQGHIARVLGLSRPDSIALAPNVHEFLVRLVSCIDARPIRVLTSGSEFHSFERQSQRLEECGDMVVERVPTEPWTTFADRFLAAAAGGGHDLVYVSQVFYDSSFVFERFAEVVQVVSDRDTLIVIDGYHAFMALPTDLASIEDRVFYTAGGYKYAMSGEGCCFLHCPPGYGARPKNTGWFAGFGQLESGIDEVAYAPDGSRFLGATLDPTPFYRFEAVQRMLQDNDITVPKIRAHVEALQGQLLDGLRPSSCLRPEQLVPDRGNPRGNFLTFRTSTAQDLKRQLLEAGVVTDARADRLRFGFGIYQDAADVDALLQRLTAIAS